DARGFEIGAHGHDAENEVFRGAMRRAIADADGRGGVGGCQGGLEDLWARVTLSDAYVPEIARRPRREDGHDARPERAQSADIVAGTMRSSTLEVERLAEGGQAVAGQCKGAPRERQGVQAVRDSIRSPSTRELCFEKRDVPIGS